MLEEEIKPMSKEEQWALQAELEEHYQQETEAAFEQGVKPKAS